jgi:NTE family protein
MWLFSKPKKKTILVLGGGSARAIAHVGVLKILQRESIPIDMIIGTSMGAVVGATYALGISTAKMEERACRFSANDLLDPVIPSMGLLKGDKLEASIRDTLEGKGFGDCRIPLAVVTTDIENGDEVVYQNGDLIKIIRASCSWPGIFNPVKIDGRLLVDGGIKNSVPTKVAKNLGCDYMIAVDVGFCVRSGKIENAFQMILQSFQITGHELNRYQAQEADIVIEVDLGDLNQTEFERSAEAIAKGEGAALAKISRIKKDLGIRV